MEDAISSESAPVTVRRIEKVSHELVVENYSLRCKGIGVGKAIESDRFVVAGQQWTIRVYPDGEDDAAYNDGYASLFIKNESTQPVEFVAELYVVDQSDKANDWGISSFQGRNTFRQVKSLAPGRMTGALRFITQAIVDSPEHGYLKDDCLKIRASIGALTYHIHNQPLIDIGIGADTDFGKLLESKLSADVCVIFRVADQRFYAHKSVLAARCPALLSRLSDVDQLQDIVIPDMDTNAFKAVLWFIYNVTLHREDQEAVSVSSPFDLKSFAAKMLAAADLFELKSLKEICESRILEKVSGESVGYLLHLADNCHATRLKSACLRFAAENQPVVIESEGNEYLKETCPLLFLELAGFKENCSTKREGVLGFCNKMMSGLKESVASTFGPLKHKIKEI